MTHLLEDVVAIALAEDLGHGGDRTSSATVAADATARAAFVARKAGVVAGLAAAAAVFAAVDATVRFTPRVTDGAHVEAGATIACVSGRTRSLLAGERTALNLLSHLSGVATITARYVEAVAGTGCVVRDTRKTLPGLRALQKAAVTAGGGANHRSGLHDALLVKDNHAVAVGGVGVATKAALAGADGRPVQVEVDDLDELDEALVAGARAVLLDNFGLDDLRRAVARARGEPEHVFVEASGGIDLDTVRGVAGTGVDAVAVGALTHSPRALDIGLDVVPGGKR
ncbi:MAG TPA: carboxylating nicotinate-nucleotide diphosphorylase [Egibacteraceae bacterium]|nr:carboxylating nicotinate-nucleotide diphosphorylase [Egibacteraceae bacterium]